MKIVSLITQESFKKIMTKECEGRLEELGEYWGGCLGSGDVRRNALEKIKKAGGADILLGCWGTPEIDEDVVNACGSLRLFVYGAGSIKSVISREMLERGIRVTTAAPAIGLGVAEFTVTQIYAFSKKIFYYRVKNLGEWRKRSAGPGVHVFELYGYSIGVVGAGYVGRNVIRLLKAYGPDIMCYDPFLSEADAESLGVRKINDLVELASKSMVLTLHAPRLPQTHHMIDGEVLKALPRGALLVNTARGWLVDEDALIKELETGRIYACLDVTDPEPPLEGSPLYSLENVFLTPHIAGCVAENYRRQSACMVNEVEAFVKGRPLSHEVTVECYDRMA